MTINQRLFTIIEEKSLKQSDLARLLGVRTSVIASWKTRGTNPPIEYTAQICEFLDISVYEFLGIKSKNKIENLYLKLSPKDKEVVDNILSRYDQQELPSSTSKIG